MFLKKQQPATKNYFFEKSFIDWKRGFRKVWSTNVEISHKILSFAQDSWDDDNHWLKIISVLAFISSLLTITVGVLLIIPIFFVYLITICICFFFVTCWGLLFWINERGYRTFRRISIICRKCNTRFKYPEYKCPDCGKLHSKLIPSNYGIICRKCICGHKLPTTFRRRQKTLRQWAICPNCKTNIYTKEITPISIATVGGPGSGKSCYIQSAVKTFIDQIAPKAGWSIHFLEKDDEDHFRKISKYFNDGILPEKTINQRPQAFNFYVKSNHWSPEKLLYIFDPAGEIFHDANNKQKYYEYLAGLVLIIDPMSIPKVRAKYLNNSSIDNEDMLESPDRILDTLINTLRKYYKTISKIDIPLSIVINKMDLFDLEDIIGKRAVVSEKKANIKSDNSRIHQLCINFLIEAGYKNFVNNVKSYFSYYHFFSCSSLGYSSKNKNESFRPFRVINPISWILCQHDHDFVKGFKQLNKL